MRSTPVHTRGDRNLKLVQPTLQGPLTTPLMYRRLMTSLGISTRNPVHLPRQPLAQMVVHACPRMFHFICHRRPRLGPFSCMRESPWRVEQQPRESRLKMKALRAQKWLILDFMRKKFDTTRLDFFVADIDYNGLYALVPYSHVPFSILVYCTPLYGTGLLSSECMIGRVKYIFPLVVGDM